MIFNLNEQKVLSDPSGSSVFKGEKDFNDIVVNLPDEIDGHTATELNYVMHFVDSDGGYSTKVLTVDSSGGTLKATATVSTSITSKAQAFYAYVLMTDDEETVIGKTNGVIVMIHPVPDEENEIIPPADADKIIKGLEEIVKEATETIETATDTIEEATEAISSKQDKLTAGQNITIDEDNVISAEGGVTSYNDLTDKPQINSVTLSGNKRNSDLGFSNFYYGESNPPIYTSSAYDDYYQLNDIWINTITNTAFRLDYRGKYELLWHPLRVKVFLDGGTPPKYEDEITNSHRYNAGDLWIDRGSTDGVRPSYYLDKGIYICLGSQRQSTPPYGRYNISWFRLDTRIIGATVNDDGTITFTDSDGNTFTTSGSNLVTSGNEQIGMGYDNGGFYFLFDDGQGA